MPGVRECARRAATACQLVAGVLIIVIVRLVAGALDRHAELRLAIPAICSHGAAGVRVRCTVIMGLAQALIIQTAVSTSTSAMARLNHSRRWPWASQVRSSAPTDAYSKLLANA